MTNVTLLNTNETYTKLQPFQSIEELNENTTAIRELFGDHLSKSAREVLDVLHRYSCKYVGVSYLSKSKIAEIVGVTRRTVIRACQTLESLGVIVQHELKRHNGDRRQSASAIVFVDVRDGVKGTKSQRDVTPECHTVDTPINTPNKTINNKDTYITEKRVFDKKESVANPTDKETLKTSLPSGWYDEAFPYVRDYNELYTITGLLYKAKSKTDIKIENYAEEFGEVLRKTWAKLKNGYINADRYHAYLFVAFRNTAHRLERSEMVKPLQAEFMRLIEA